MDSVPLTPTTDVVNKAAGTPVEVARLRKFLIAGAALLLCFSLPLYQVMAFALGSEFYSYILIVPLISFYLVWIERSEFYPAGTVIPVGWAVTFLTGGLGLLVWAGLLLLGPIKPEHADVLALSMGSLVLLLAGSACFFLGRQTLRVFAFPLAFLVFLAPFPVGVETSLETMLQQGSSATAHFFLSLAGMPVFRNGTYLQLPGFAMQVAPECSGIRSTVALLLTSLVAGRLFLRSPWKRLVLVLIVLPLALLRNGFRVFVIGELCVRVGPEMIDSWIHHQGGPVFFALSLLPFSLALYYLYKSEHPVVGPALPPRN